MHFDSQPRDLRRGNAVFSFGTWLLLLFGISSCAGTGDDLRKAPAEKPFERIANEKFGQGVSFAPNPSGPLVLCYRARKPTSQAPQRTIDFLVYDVASDKIVYEESLPDGEVAWKDGRHLQITIRPGIIPGEDAQQQPVSYLVDVLTHQRTPLSEDLPPRNN